MLKVDLHTHSVASKDGGLTLAQYETAVSSGALNVIAITDHNTIDFAVEARKKMGSSIIVGEEIMTTDGEIIGLFLTERIAPHKSPEATIQAIRSQGGVVYVPHPFETVRKGLPLATLDRIATEVDLIEVYNGRVMQRSTRAQTAAWAKKHAVSGVASSDAHGNRGWGQTYSIVTAMPTAANVRDVFQNVRLVQKDVGIIGRMYPTINRLKKGLHRA